MARKPTECITNILLRIGRNYFSWSRALCQKREESNSSEKVTYSISSKIQLLKMFNMTAIFDQTNIFQNGGFNIGKIFPAPASPKEK